MKRTLLLIGGDGMLGQDVAAELAERFDVIRPTEAELDIADLAGIRKAIRNVRPDLVVNAAAFTDVDACEGEVDKAFLVNAIGARNLAVQAERFSAELVHISTDYVFDGTADRAYTEFDPGTPKGVYARSKWAGEEMVRSLCRRHYVLRISVLFGPGSRSFVDAVVDRARRGEDVRVPAGRVGCPTYTRDVARAVAALAGSERFGTFHFNQGESLTRAEFARRILSAGELGGIKIEEVDPSSLDEKAPRPVRVEMDMTRWRLEGLPAPMPLDEALKDWYARKEGDGVTQGKARDGLREDASGARIHQRERPRAWVPARDVETGALSEDERKEMKVDEWDKDRERPPPREGGGRDTYRSGARRDGPGRDGPRRDAPRRDGPRRDGPRRDGPRRDGPGRDGPRRDGPRRDGPRRDGPGRDGPRRDGPRHSGHRGAPPRRGSPWGGAPPRDGGARSEAFYSDRSRRDGPRRDGPRRDGPRRDGPRRDGPRRDGPRREESPPKDKSPRPDTIAAAPPPSPDVPPAATPPRDPPGEE